jgi:hypothetical protein
VLFEIVLVWREELPFVVEPPEVEFVVPVPEPVLEPVPVPPDPEEPPPTETLFRFPFQLLP